MLKRFFIFLALVAIICGVFYFSSPKLPMLRSEPLWPSVLSKQVDKIDICRSGKDCFSLVRKTGGWDVVQQDWNEYPLADTSKVDRLLRVLAQGHALKYIGRMTGKNRQQYGLLVPQIRISTGGGQALSLTIGDRSPSDEGSFAVNSLSQNDLFVLNNDFVRRCDFPAEYYFNLQLLSGEVNNISSISLSNGDSPLWTIVRQKDQFVFSFPVTLTGQTARSGEIDLFLHSLMETPAKGLVSGSSEKLGNLLFSLEVLFRDKSIKSIDFFDVEGDKDYYLANSTIQNGFFVLSKEHVDQLNKTAFGMRKRSILSVETGKIGSIRVLQGNQTFIGIKSDKNWESLDERKPLLGIDMSLWRLNELKFEAEPISDLSSSAVKAMELELMNVAGSRLVKVVFFTDPELPSGLCWLSLGDDKGYYQVSNKLLEDLQGQIPLRK
ncbi:DUF4340 domain-containing protein [Desulfovibrio sp. UCD-KL4C]|uniref:DUF4340 domain-containing protein n=1 Tax=Desulfovibrio sp. UCD-KL4C TaxID=2578120 RepID=UPI0025C7115C|nr:DUF4340 domain-containing protein [Desulfovibrio sp. UCD-KL4C]